VGGEKRPDHLARVDVLGGDSILLLRERLVRAFLLMGRVSKSLRDYFAVLNLRGGSNGRVDLIWAEANSGMQRHLLSADCTVERSLERRRHRVAPHFY